MTTTKRRTEEMIAKHAIHTSDITALIAFITERNENARAESWMSVSTAAQIKAALLEVACMTEYTQHESEDAVRERVMLAAWGTLGRRAAAAEDKAYADKMERLRLHVANHI